MKYLTFSDRASAQARTGAVATALGCGQHPDDVTKYWFGIVTHPGQAPLSALVVPPEDEDLLTAQERSQLKDYAHMATQGWFPDDTPTD